MFSLTMHVIGADASISPSCDFYDIMKYMLEVLAKKIISPLSWIDDDVLFSGYDRTPAPMKYSQYPGMHAQVYHKIKSSQLQQGSKVPPLLCATDNW